MPKPRRETMSKVDTAWLRMEQPRNLMMINGVIAMERGLKYKQLLKTIDERLLLFSRFRQKVVDGPAGTFWQEDEDFDIRSHVRRVALPGKADRAELELLVSELASTPLIQSRPLWQFHLVENYQDGPVLIVRIHHCIADGIALVQVFLSLTDPSPEPRSSAIDPERLKKRRSEESPVFRRLMEPAREGFDFMVDVGRKALEEGGRVLAEPSRAGHYMNEASAILGELGTMLALPEDPRTPFKGRLGVSKQAAWAEPLPLADVKAVSKAFSCTVNDVLIASVAGALRRHLLDRGVTEEDLCDIRATVPVNLRPLDHALELGNHFGLVFLSMPLAEPNPLQRLYAVNERMNELKASRQAAVSLGVLAALGMGPSALQQPILDVLSEKATAVLTNVPGPGKPMYLGGVKMREIMFWVPQNGTIGLGISILSYNNQVFFGLMADRRLVPNPNDVIRYFKPEFEKLMYLGMMLPLVGRPNARQAHGLLERAIEELG